MPRGPFQPPLISQIGHWAGISASGIVSLPEPVRHVRRAADVHHLPDQSRQRPDDHRPPDGDGSAVGGQTPIDCDLGKTAPNQESMTCANRPATQTWYLDVDCHYPLGDPELVGNQVTGNGTSAGTCSAGYTLQHGAYFQTV